MWKKNEIEDAQGKHGMINWSGVRKIEGNDDDDDDGFYSRMWGG